MSKLGPARWDDEAQMLLAPMLAIVRQSDDGKGLVYHGFTGENTAVLYRDHEAARHVASTLDPAMGWRVLLVAVGHRLPEEWRP